MAVKTVQDLLIHELRDIYHAEKQLIRALPRLARAATDPELKAGIEQHLEETRGQVERLEQIFEELDIATRGKPCEAMQGLVEEAREVIDEIKNPEVLDAALIVAAQKVEHYEISSYGSLHALAQSMGQDRIAQLLEETLNEEKATDQKLNKLAIGNINKKALKKAAA
jgi:ferritin-like metal-binding protein YciE